MAIKQRTDQPLLFQVQREPETKICSICGKVYEKSKTVSRKVWNASRFCSKACINIGRTPWNKNKRGVTTAWNKGRKSPETMGPGNPAWIGGDRKYHRNVVLVRDDYTCQVCGLREPEIMQVDHIKPESLFPELARSAENMKTLCPNCHARKSVRELKSGISVRGKKAAQAS